MGRPKRIATGNIVYHAINRANGRLRIFKKRQDFEAFESILAEGVVRYNMRLCGYCLMSNHWHLVLWPRADGDLTDFMRWVADKSVELGLQSTLRPRGRPKKDS